MKNRIVVGYDGSVPSAAAVNWAAAEAVRRQAALFVLSCYSSPVGVDWISGAAAAVTYDIGEIERVTLGSADAMAAEIRRRHPELRCEGRAVFGAPRDVLVDESAGADLMVVGKTGGGAVKALFMGSVANAVVRRSSCPTVVVPACSTAREETGEIVVGVDDSPASDAALAWALDEASLRGADLVVAHAWSYVYTGAAIASAQARDIMCVDARSTLDRIVTAASTRATGCSVRGRLVEDSPSAALLDEGADADLLVVGSRGRGGLRSMLFGSVAHAVTEHAPCPTVVILCPPHDQ